MKRARVNSLNQWSG